MRIEPKGLLVICVCALAGCATGPAPSRAPSTPYKGDAVWNISLSDPAHQADGRASGSHLIHPPA
jgi:hypothetical protein